MGRSKVPAFGKKVFSACSFSAASSTASIKPAGRICKTVIRGRRRRAELFDRARARKRKRNRMQWRRRKRLRRRLLACLFPFQAAPAKALASLRHRDQQERYRESVKNDAKALPACPLSLSDGKGAVFFFNAGEKRERKRRRRREKKMFPYLARLDALEFLDRDDGSARGASHLRKAADGEREREIKQTRKRALPKEKIKRKQ